ncbi:hypothetical protein [Streptomyces sp. NPDC021356]|uniref:hypothetical protein n=1 Tax=Streptomyces sp. NPDC021356 TaxID=3154900 RepID=UPI0033FF5003
MAVDPVVDGLVIALSGMSIPEGSAERVRAEIVVPHLEPARFLTGLEGALGDITGATVKGAQGEAMQAYAQAVSQLTSGDGADYVKGLKDTALQLADAGNEFAYQLDYTNMMIVEQVVLFFAELALIATLEVFNPIQAAFEKLALDTFFRELFTTELTQFLARTAAQTASIMTMNVVLAAALDGLTDGRGQMPAPVTRLITDGFTTFTGPVPFEVPPTVRNSDAPWNRASETPFFIAAELSPHGGTETTTPHGPYTYSVEEFADHLAANMILAMHPAEPIVLLIPTPAPAECTCPAPSPPAPDAPSGHPTADSHSSPRPPKDSAPTDAA